MEIFTVLEYQKKHFPHLSWDTIVRRINKKQIPSHHIGVKKGRDYIIIVDEDIRVKRGLPFDVTIKSKK